MGYFIKLFLFSFEVNKDVTKHEIKSKGLKIYDALWF